MRDDEQGVTMYHTLAPVSRAFKSGNVLALIFGSGWLFVAVGSVLAQSAPPPQATVTFPIVFPPSVQTTYPGPVTCAFTPPQPLIVPGPNGADTAFYVGQFIKYGSQTIYALSDSSSFCATTGYFNFSLTAGRPYSQLPIGVTVQIVNLGPVDDVIYGVASDDYFYAQLIAPQLIRSGGVATFSVQGSHLLGLGFASFAHANNYDFPSVYGITSITITQPKGDELKLEARNLSNLGVLETKPLTEQGISAQIPLGATFSLRLTKSGTPPVAVPAAWSSSANKPDPGVLRGSLFQTDVLSEYDKTGPATDNKQFYAAHLGTEKVTIVPADASLPARTVTVTVYPPRTLGNPPHQITDGISGYDLDQQIVKWSHARGVPPQAVKAIMYNESSPAFNAKTWRYEPLSTDWEEFSPNGANKRSLAQYDSYKMEYDATHARGASLVDSQDVHPRRVFYRDFATRAPIDDPEQMVTALTIFQENDRQQNWLKYVTVAKRALILRDPRAVLDWSAQTTLAASYGLMQVLYEESYEQGWQGIAGEKRPYFLFDVPANVPDGGSIEIGTGVLASKFRVVSKTMDFHDSGAFDAALQLALSCYNSCSRRNPHVTAYGQKAFGNIGICMPSADVSIFN